MVRYFKVVFGQYNIVYVYLHPRSIAEWRTNTNLMYIYFKCIAEIFFRDEESTSNVYFIWIYALLDEF